MNHLKSLKTILIDWAHYYHYNGTEKCLDDLLENVGNNPIPSDFELALEKWFGTVTPDDEDMEIFMDKYVDWMHSIDNSYSKILLGDITIDEVLLQRIIYETWI